MADDHRRYPRFDVERKARLQKTDADDDRTTGIVKDLSASGVSVCGLEQPDGFDEGDPVDVEVLGMKPRHGQVVRVIEDCVAVDFGLDEEDEHDAIAELGIVTGELSRILGD